MLQQRWPTGRTNRWRVWWKAFALFALLVFVSSTRTKLLTDTDTWAHALRLSLGFWLAWALLCPLILLWDRALPFDRWLPAVRGWSNTRLLVRLFLHLPLSLTAAAIQIWLSSGLKAAGLTDLLYQAALGSSVLVYWGIVAVAIARDYHEHASERRTKALELEKLLAESRFDTLRTRLHPHVLFNTLNTISSCIDTDPREARWLLEQFGTMLRLSLEHAREPEIPLERELAYVECYLDLQKTHFEDRFDVITRIAPEALDAYVPTFILQPLVENALRHGVLMRSTSGQILIDAHREGATLRLSIRDNGPGVPKDWGADGAGVLSPIHASACIGSTVRIRALTSPQRQALASTSP